MANMYYTENPNVEHDIHELNVKLLGESFSFLTDAGVFSKRMIDYGSQVLLNSLHFEKNKSLLDLGCGYGPLGISLAKVQGVKATMVDINTRALELAKKNATRNGVVVEVFQSNIYENISKTFDYIISNPLFVLESKLFILLSKKVSVTLIQAVALPLSFKRNKALQVQKLKC